MENNLKNNTFNVVFYKRKPHWTSDYFDVFSGAGNESMKDYRDKVLIEGIMISKVVFEFNDFENAIFRLNYQKTKINPYEVSYIKIQDIYGIFQSGGSKEIYFFVSNMKINSAGIATFSCILDYWMTFWEHFEWNNKSCFVMRRHFPRYRTDEKHKGEYDFSTNSPILNIDNIEITYQNLITIQSKYLYVYNIYRNLISLEGEYFAYALILPKREDASQRNRLGNQQDWVTYGEMQDKKSNLIGEWFADGIAGKEDPFFTKHKSISGWPFIIINLSDHADYVHVPWRRNFQYTNLCYSYKSISFLGDRFVSTFYADHPLFDIDRLVVNGNFTIYYINGLSNKDVNNSNLDKNQKEILGMNFYMYKNDGWEYVFFKDDETLKVDHINYHYQPNKIYDENDSLSLDQEPALYRYPHLIYEVNIFSCKGVLQIYNELSLSNGFNNEHLLIKCDYVIHNITLLKYIYTLSGLYENEYINWKNGLFDEQIYSLTLITDKYQEFMQQNMYRFNTSYNQKIWNAGLSAGVSGIGATAGIIAGVATGGIGLVAGLGIASAGLLGIGNSIKDGIFGTQRLNAQLKDLQRTPATITNQSGYQDISKLTQMSNAKFLGLKALSFKYPKGSVCIRQHKENEQWILYYHFYQYGYLINKLMKVKDLQWFYSRYWFDYFMIEDFSNVINQNRHNQLLINKFNNIFKRGVRLWHKIDNFLEYDKNNLEIETWKQNYL